MLGKLRKGLSALRLGDIRFFRAAGGQLDFCRSDGCHIAHIYANQSKEGWDIPADSIIFSHLLRGHTLAPGGFCIRKEDKEIWRENTF
jgi:hypothetical protein